VKIKMGGRGRGKLQIDFGDLDALEGILARLRTGAADGKSEAMDNLSAAQA
jgi:ParB family transcriptional regulator, chromosome partitioning protein